MEVSVSDVDSLRYHSGLDSHQDQSLSTPSSMGRAALKPKAASNFRVSAKVVNISDSGLGDRTRFAGPPASDSRQAMKSANA